MAKLLCKIKVLITRPTLNFYITVMKFIKNKIYLGTAMHGLWVSSDNGQTFTQDKNIPIDSPITAIAPALGFDESLTTIFVGTKQGLYGWDGEYAQFEKSTLIPEKADITAIASTDKYSDEDYVSIIIATKNYGIYEASGEAVIRSFRNYSFWGSMTITQIVFNNKTIELGTAKRGLWESFDGGTNFYQNADVPTTNAVKQINQINKVVYACTNDGLYQSFDDGKTFEDASHNLALTDSLQDLTVDQIMTNNNIIYVGTSPKKFYSHSGGIWQTN